MRISKRLYKLADCVKPGDSVADIGTDHGYVPMLLVKNGVSPHVIMSDISEGSLSKAVETFKLTGLMDKVSESDFRVGDGLDTLEAGETDEIIIAGLGGHTIVEILDADIKKSKSFRRVVMQPRKHSGTLRYYLYTHGWEIESECLAEEGKFACEVITAVPDPDRVPGILRDAPYPEDDIRWKYPEALIKTDYLLMKKRIDWKISSIKEEIGNLKRSGKDQETLINRLNDDLSYLEDLLKYRSNR